MPECPRSVLIADDNEMIRRALGAFLQDYTDLAICGEAVDGTEAIQMAKRFHPSLILMDLVMPNANGVEAAWAIRRFMPQVQIILFTLYSDLVGQCLAKYAGVDTIVSKTEGAEGLMRALRPLLDSHPASIPDPS